MERTGESTVWRRNFVDVWDAPKPWAIYALNSLTEYTYADFIGQAVSGDRYREKRKVRKSKVQRRRAANKAARKARRASR